jgi:hypothetical protein
MEPPPGTDAAISSFSNFEGPRVGLSRGQIDVDSDEGDVDIHFDEDDDLLMIEDVQQPLEIILSSEDEDEAGQRQPGSRVSRPCRQP